MDDLLRRRFDRTAVAARLAAMFAALTAAGATVTFPDIGRLVPIARRLPAARSSRGSSSSGALVALLGTGPERHMIDSHRVRGVRP
jgi:hypothetical protein